MSTCCKCNFETCNCDTVVPFTVDCTTPNKCSDKEMFSSECFEFMGSDIKCNNQSIIYANNTLSQALSNIVEFQCAQKCELNVTITNPEDLQLVANVTGGTAPYTYLWEAQQNNFVGHQEVGGVDQATLNLELQYNAFLNGTETSFIHRTMLKLTVTDAENCKKEVYYRYVSSNSAT